MLLRVTPVTAPGSQSLCCTLLDFSLLPTCVCSPVPVRHREGLGCLSRSRQHGATGCWAVLPHRNACLLQKQKAGKSHSPKTLGFQRKRRGGEERQIPGLGDPQAAQLKTRVKPGTDRRRSQQDSPLRTGVGNTAGDRRMGFKPPSSNSVHV